MIHKTKGLVIHTLKYTDNSVISHIYTEKFGRQSFLINGMRGKRSNKRINFLQHLSILEMEVYFKQNRDLQRIKEIELSENFFSIPYDPVKNAVALFLSEVIYRTLYEQEPNETLFSYLVNAIKILDLADKGYANFHLIFLLGYARHLGFSPDNNYSASKEYFDIENARFTGKKYMNTYFIEPPASRILSQIMECTFENMDSLRLNSGMRNMLVSRILDYYRFHVAGMGTLKSFQVLKEVF